MRRRKITHSSLAVAVLSAASIVLAVTVATTSAKQGRAADPPIDEATLLKQGEALTDQICGECHELDTVYTRRKSVKEWADTVRDMTTRGASATESQLSIVRRFLTRTYGAVTVNTATAEEFSAVLGLSAKDAALIVEYRKANGDFADRAALGKVQGIDQTKLDEQPEALVFKKSSEVRGS